MFKIGEKVVCINTGEITVNMSGFGRLRKARVKHIKENQIYTVGNENAENRDLSLVEIGYDIYYSWERFVSLVKYRKIKLQKICTKLEIK
jgi:hypothetical protein